MRSAMQRKAGPYCGTLLAWEQQTVPAKIIEAGRPATERSQHPSKKAPSKQLAWKQVVPLHIGKESAATRSIDVVKWQRGAWAS